MYEYKRPKVGVGVIIIRKNKVLLGRRKNAHGEHAYNFPGGHLEFGEDIEACARREVLEETGLILGNVRIGPFTNDIFEAEGKHYLTIFAIGDSKTNDPQVIEPDKCEGWGWYKWDNLPEPLFTPIVNLLKQGFNPFSWNK